jgi:hypothetical protein
VLAVTGMDETQRDRDAGRESVCECGYPHGDYCGGELCDVCESCGATTICDECAAEQRVRDLERAEALAEEDGLLYGV